jgi:divalent metal cation (Fe/Co/Zn/Cd) transporter
MVERANLTRFAWLSIGAAVLTIWLKTTAYWLTGSIGLLSDALESLVNFVDPAAWEDIALDRKDSSPGSGK